MGAALSLTCLLLAACGEPQSRDPLPPLNDDALERDAIVTGAFDASQRAGAMAFLPSTSEPWTGLVAVALSDGGFDVFNIDGLGIATTGGPRLTSLTGVSDFPLRGEVFPLMFGADDDGRLRAYAVLRSVGDIVELPLSGSGLDVAVSGACLYGQGIGYFDLALLLNDNQARIVRVRDSGGAGLEATAQTQFDLPFAARRCAGVEGGLVVGATTSGLASVSEDGDVLGFQNDAVFADLAAVQMFGTEVALSASTETGRISVFNAQTLEPMADLALVDGLNAPAAQAPGSITATAASYGGMAFSNGLVAIYDREDSRVKLVALEVVARSVFVE